MAWIAIGISAASLIVAIAALWRTHRFRVLDLRTSIRKDVVALGQHIDTLIKTTIPTARLSRTSVAALLQPGLQSSRLKLFMDAADTDCAKLDGLRKQLSDLEPIPWYAGYGTMAAKAVIVHGVQGEATILEEKYAAAARQDADLLQHRQRQVIGKP